MQKFKIENYTYPLKIGMERDIKDILSDIKEIEKEIRNECPGQYNGNASDLYNILDTLVNEQKWVLDLISWKKRDEIS